MEKRMKSKKEKKIKKAEIMLHVIIHSYYQFICVTVEIYHLNVKTIMCLKFQHCKTFGNVSNSQALFKNIKMFRSKSGKKPKNIMKCSSKRLFLNYVETATCKGTFTCKTNQTDQDLQPFCKSNWTTQKVEVMIIRMLPLQCTI